jgi:hypothetical protein
MKLPYGMADFRSLVTNGYTYVDRTAHIRTMEELGRSLLFVRPRRFGKSLWLRTLVTYYDLRLLDEHEQIFGDLAIGKEPTPLAHSYFVLVWNFSKIDPQGGGAADPIAGVGKILDDYVNGSIENFLTDYQDCFDQSVQIEENALRTLGNLLAAIRRTPHKLYLLIDEYDNFANEILMSDDEATYRRLVHADGPFKRLMKWVKAATEGEGIERLFLTGVTPVVLSDLTSGLNIATDISLDPACNALCGFTQDDSRRLLEELALEQSQLDGGFSFSPEEALDMVRTWYNGYRFNADARERIYNPTLTLYFLHQIQRHRRYPRQMLDANLAADENKLTFLAHETEGGDVLAELVQTGRPLEVERIEDRFVLSKMLTQARENVTGIGSFLFYFGMLTIEAETARQTLLLAPPNLVVKKLYIDETLRLLMAGQRGAPNLAKPAWELMEHGNFEPLLQLVEERLLPIFSQRDARWMNELAVKTAFMALLFQDVNYRLHSEPTIAGGSVEGDAHGYADLVLLLRPDARSTPFYDLLFEFKYVKTGALGEDAERLDVLGRDELERLPGVRAKLEEGARQARSYRAGLVKRYGDVLRLRSFVVVALGFERLVAREVLAESSGADQ